MRRTGVKRTLIAVSFSVLIATLPFLGTTSADSHPTNASGIPQLSATFQRWISAFDRKLTALDKQVAAMDRQVTALDKQVAAMGRQATALDQQTKTLGQQVSAFGERLSAFDQRLATLGPASAGAKGLRVVDTNGQEVGPLISKSEVSQKLGSQWLVLAVGPSGFTESAPLFYNDKPDCTGALYVYDQPDLMRQAFVVGKTVYYGEGNPQPVTVVAYEYVLAGGNYCTTMPAAVLDVSKVATADLSKFVPPFTVQYN